ncbi:MAG: hypothetical protein AAGK97_07385 [Bacteroidota bacterium]
MDAGPSANGTVDVSPLATHASNRAPHIIKFCGRINNKTADLESFLESLDCHINACRFTEAERLSEAKAFLDFSKGDIKTFVASYEFREIKTYEGFKSYLRGIYGVMATEDPVKALSKIFRFQKLYKGYYLDYAHDAFIQYDSLLNSLFSSDTWVDQGSDVISKRNLKALLHLSSTLSVLPEPLAEAIDEEWQPCDSVSALSRRVQKHMAKVPHIDLSSVKQSVKCASVGNVNMNQYPRISYQPKMRKPIICTNCQKPNHMSKECYAPPFCLHHGSSGHRTDQCRSTNNSRMQSNHNNNQRSFRTMKQVNNRRYSFNKGRFNEDNSRNSRDVNRSQTNRNYNAENSSRSNRSFSRSRQNSVNLMNEDGPESVNFRQDWRERDNKVMIHILQSQSIMQFQPLIDLMH